MSSSQMVKIKRPIQPRNCGYHPANHYQRSYMHLYHAVRNWWWLNPNRGKDGKGEPIRSSGVIWFIGRNKNV